MTPAYHGFRFDFSPKRSPCGEKGLGTRLDDKLGQEPLTASILACAGCGKDLSDKERDRRDLHKSQTARALQGWRSILKHLGLENKEGNISKRVHRVSSYRYSPAKESPAKGPPSVMVS